MSDPKLVIGLDEAGRGCFAGPVVAAAVAFDHFDLPSESLRKKLDDSKKIPPKRRLKIFQEILIEAHKLQPKLAFGLGIVDNHLIDEINIFKASHLAMQRALNELSRKIDHRHIKTIIVDGRANFSFEGFDKKPLHLIKADQKIPEVQAASIIAKVFRDRLMETYALIYPEHGFEQHKGYGTPKHQAVISQKSRITGIHRLSYKPLIEVIKKKPRILLHVCCGPDACIPIVDLKAQYEIIGFWYDPNIQPREEYEKRKLAFSRICKIENIEWHEGEYDIANFFKEIRGLEMTPERGEKCTKCYDMRLKRSILKAQELKCDYWTTTLNMSPKKDFEKLSHIGAKLEKNYGIKYLALPFRKNNGFNRAVEYTAHHEIYRQTYCGCVFSDTYPGMNIKKRLKSTSFVG